VPTVAGQKLESVVQSSRNSRMIPPVRIMHWNPDFDLPIPFQSWAA
jgi:hypothetical protein